jgi:hypothetical protein
MKISNLKQLILVLSVLGINNSVFANYGTTTPSKQPVQVNDEKLILILNNLIKDGKILYDEKTGIVLLNDKLMQLMIDKKLLKDSDVQLAIDCDRRSSLNLDSEAIDQK